MQVFLYVGRLHFKVVHRKDLERQVLAARRSLHDKTSPIPGSPTGLDAQGRAKGQRHEDSLQNGVSGEAPASQ